MVRKEKISRFPPLEFSFRFFLRKFRKSFLRLLSLHSGTGCERGRHPFYFFLHIFMGNTDKDEDRQGQSSGDESSRGENKGNDDQNDM